MQWFCKTPIAHRGLHDKNRLIPENSLAAFRQAINKGFPIELDIRLLGDRTVVVFHDPNLKRATGKNVQVSGLSKKDLNKYKLFNTGQHIPTLSQVLKLVAGKVPLLIELKTDFMDGGLERALAKELRRYRGLIAVQSFNPVALIWMRFLAPHIDRGMLAGSFREEKMGRLRKIVLRNLLVAPLCRPSFIAIEARTLPTLSSTLLRRLGVPVLAWTITGDAQQHRVRTRSDNIIFEGFLPHTKAR